ncbi:hypothetical protein OUZ56_031328 [Daphnia magna]|uniref:Uncharacterized protein n=1 Tax=Daphnia magna TaxID=35525 RepID=A0ABQ9ZUE6_9CRUS|nr:hypothetical protein OUZ56_031328 [Daphnia magna]
MILNFVDTFLSFLREMRHLAMYHTSSAAYVYYSNEHCLCLLIGRDPSSCRVLFPLSWNFWGIVAPYPALRWVLHELMYSSVAHIEFTKEKGGTYFAACL